MPHDNAIVIWLRALSPSLIIKQVTAAITFITITAIQLVFI